MIDMRIHAARIAARKDMREAFEFAEKLADDKRDAEEMLDILDRIEREMNRIPVQVRRRG